MRTKRHIPFRLAPLGVGLLVGTLSGCGEPQQQAPVDPDQLIPSEAAVKAAKLLVEARPYDSKIPQNYDAQKSWPLVILLHGYGANGLGQDLYFGIGHELDRLGFLYAYPDGTLDSKNKRFWNATDVCCDFDKRNIDDVAYVDAIIDDMAAQYHVDRKRVFLVGHSNGGFMSHRYACDRSERVAAFVALAGDNFKDATRCQPKSPVAVLQVHGDKDDAVPYEGGTAPDGVRSVPSALDSVKSWATQNGCTLTADKSAPDLDLETNLDGKETTVARFPGCKPGGAAELWTIRGGSHLPAFGRPDWANAVWGWFASHPKP
jgi:polyhydroxybutyrate depolymerase